MSILAPTRPTPVPAARTIEAAGSDRADTWLAGALLGLAGGLAAVALLGPLATGVIEYRVTESLRNQTIGLDAASLVIVVPLAVAAAVLVVRHQVAGYALALPVGAYTTYMFLQYILGPDYSGLPGNNERLFPLSLALFAGGWIVSLAAWSRIGPTDTPPTAERRDRLIGRVILPLLALLTFVRYVPALADATSASPQEESYLAGPTFFWIIATVDLGVFLPITVGTCVGLVRGSGWAQKALFLTAGWFGLVGVAVSAMAIAMQINDDPTASTANTILMTALGAAFALLAIYVYHPLLRKDAQRNTKRKVTS